MDTIIVICGVYFFVLIGYVSKKTFDEIHEKTLVLLSVYFLQPMLAFWGIFGKKIEVSDLFVPMYYFAISIFGALIGVVALSKFFKNKKDVAIITASGIIGNTGNLGIPLLVGLLGDKAAFYAVLINTANVFILYIVGVFLYSAGSYTIKEALRNIISMPVIWFSLLAILLNFTGISIPSSVYQFIEMGAHASMAIQLIIFGVFLAGLNEIVFDKKLLSFAMLNKFVFIPLLAFVVLQAVNLDQFAKMIIFLQVCMPLAVSNVNLAFLYGCKPYDVTAAILISSAIFLLLIFPFIRVFG